MQTKNIDTIQQDVIELINLNVEKNKIFSFLKKRYKIENEAEYEEIYSACMKYKNNDNIEKVVSLSNVKEEEIKRLSTSIKEIDWLYGSTEMMRNNIKYLKYGVPLSRVSLWAGSPGVGKTRTLIHLTSILNKLKIKVLYFQKEASLSEFKSWTNGKIDYEDDYIISDASTVEEQANIIIAENPKVVVIDSINNIKNKDGKFDVKQFVLKFKEIASLIDCHIFLIGHLNKQKKVKGNNDLEYMVDIVVELTKNEDTKSNFFLSIPEKNRSGPVGRKIELRHTNLGVEEFSKNGFYEVFKENCLESFSNIV